MFPLVLKVFRSYLEVSGAVHGALRSSQDRDFRRTHDVSAHLWVLQENLREITGDHQGASGVFGGLKKV